MVITLRLRLFYFTYTQGIMSTWIFFLITYSCWVKQLLYVGPTIFASFYGRSPKHEDMTCCFCHLSGQNGQFVPALIKISTPTSTLTNSNYFKCLSWWQELFLTFDQGRIHHSYQITIKQNTNNLGVSCIWLERKMVLMVLLGAHPCINDAVTVNSTFTY